MSSKSLTVDQKLDLVLDKVGKLETSVKTIEINQIKMQKSIDDLSDIASQTLVLSGTTSDRVTHIENHLSENSDFTPFTSGAFAV